MPGKKKKKQTPLARVALQPLPSQRLDVLAEDTARVESGGTPNRARTMAALINERWEMRERDIADCRRAIRDGEGVGRTREAKHAAEQARARLLKLYGLQA